MRRWTRRSNKKSIRRKQVIQGYWCPIIVVALIGEREEDYIIYKNQVKEIVEIVSGNLIEECYHNAFGFPNEGGAGCSVPTLDQSPSGLDKTLVANSVNSGENDAADGGERQKLMVVEEELDANTLNGILVEHADGQLEEKVEESMLGQQLMQNLLIDTTLLTKVNVMDMECMGFRKLGSKDVNDENGMGGDKSACPPHRKNRRKSWGEEVEEELCSKRQHKKEKKKEHKQSKFSFGSPKTTRGKMREIMAGAGLSAEDSP